MQGLEPARVIADAHKSLELRPEFVVAIAERLQVPNKRGNYLTSCRSRVHVAGIVDNCWVSDKLAWG